MTETKDYSWDASSKLMQQAIDTQALPQRFALTAPQVLVTRGDQQMLLIDPHPAGTWETWMFPYASLVLTADEIRGKLSDLGTPRLEILNPPDGYTFADLTRGLHDLKHSLLAEYEQAIRAEVNNVLPQLEGTWTLEEPTYENYSLKYSKTSESYTAYLFEYSISETSVSGLSVPFMWVTPMKLADEIEAHQDPLVDGKKVSSNVVDALPALISQLS